ncbi:hypothetical protein [Pedobacter endophyticus]|uniref:Heat induced stress protein YflT n=1 Tax=Pedobacter endophyticus TaxID=2789740 RepID=A0A7U3Q4T5_9SPHI|nr:hypothetical protein [Pedobacter endophyticus]QPH38608.1 hypothetical protein IZT61_16195 [Pedobacter endophyticus]
MDEPINNTNLHYISGLFSDKHSAENAYNYLLKKGYVSEEINVAMASTTKDKLYSISQKSGEVDAENEFNAPLEGGIMGGIMGGVAFAIGALGSNLGIRGLNLVMIGPVASGVIGSSLGAIAGGLIGRILSSDEPGKDSALFSEGLKNGKILLVFIPHNQEDASDIYNHWVNLEGMVTNNNQNWIT